ncbi:MAG: hypothetical protein RIS17_585, partial [Pseudomonadota bacterium]
MKIVAPVEIGFGDLISSNIAEELPRATGTTTYTAWSATTTYSAGTQVCWIFTVDRNFYTLSGTGP